jgi:hemerythrin-like domain-containing protein
MHARRAASRIEEATMESVRPGQLLEDEHRRIDKGLEDILEGTGSARELIESLALLRRHVYLEHEILFPPLTKAGLVMPVLVMKREHAQMWPLIDGLASACESGSAVETLRASCGELLRLLQRHNPKEEQILYAAADRLDAERADGWLARALEAGRMPDGWTCPPIPN